MEMKEFRKAEKEFRLSIKLEPNRPQSYYFLAKLFTLQGQFSEAHEWLIAFFQLPTQEPWKEAAAELKKEVAIALH
jgi:tetratricopeptide (TPR) repeat protein